MSLQPAQEIIRTSKDMYTEIESIRLTIINIRVSVAKIKHIAEARALDTIADHIEQSLLDLEVYSKTITELAKKI